MSSGDQEVTQKAAISSATEWGKSPLPPTLLATLITALYARPFKPLPMLFPPVLLFSAYLNLSNFKVDSAGLTAAWSGLYLLLARRRKVAGANFSSRLGAKYGARGMTRGSAMLLAGANVLGCGITYAFGSRKAEEKKDPLA
ncbi:hypothetical protein PZA11_003820 [Diplocarpon coronariae]|uniref:Uncharacterized protein n=1 Tax=Diplocarpon coronariae TaxID=2795749 RepID=A0A218Z7E6_9HELO|nr:hypothetical protein JHW43_006222 [Diplocarpon mali]OWP03634.1 hypothetical protein B2J93_3255 [Marssonina coronariae]